MLCWNGCEIEIIIEHCHFLHISQPYTWWRPSPVFIRFNPNSIGKIVHMQKTNHNDYHLVVLFLLLQMLWRTQNGRLCAAKEALCQKQNKWNHTTYNKWSYNIKRRNNTLCFLPTFISTTSSTDVLHSWKTVICAKPLSTPSAFVTQGNQLWSFYTFVLFFWSNLKTSVTSLSKCRNVCESFWQKKVTISIWLCS